VPNNSLSDAFTYLASKAIQELEGKKKKVAQNKLPQQAKPEALSVESTKPDGSKTASAKGRGVTEGSIRKTKPKVETSTQGLRVTRLFVSPELSPAGRAIRKSMRKRRHYIPVKIKRAVFARANSCCEYQDPQSGRKCGSRYQPQVDHIKPVALGGTDEPSNLRLLCGVHNRYQAKRWGLGSW